MKKPVIEVEFGEHNSSPQNSRRRFLKNSGLLVAGTGLFLYSCSDENLDEELVVADARAGKVFNLGKGDLGILNYAYVLEQLEAAFYEKVLEGNYYAGADAEEQRIFRDIYYHEVIHRDFFELALNSVAPPGKIAPELIFNFSSVDFGSREQVLNISQILEDTGVAAYNGAGNLLENPDYLLVAGKIVSVEARHASTIRNLIQPGSTNFAADEILVNLLGTGEAYDRAVDPRDILQAVKETGFLETKIIANNLPTQ